MTPTTPMTPMTPTTPMIRRRTGLLRNVDFRRLWTADAVSQAGTAVTVIALPLVAIGTLHATAFQAGLLVAFEYLGFLLVGLPAGAWVDRVRRRGVMVVADVCRATLLASVPLAFWAGSLTLAQLYLVAFGLSVCTVFFDVAYGGYLPDLVDDAHLVEANVKLETARSTVQAGGPGVGGALVGVLTAPVAVTINMLTYLLSAVFLLRIGHGETEARASAKLEKPSLRTDIALGLRFVFGNRLLRAITLTSAISNLCGTIGASMLLVLLAGQLKLSPLLCGLVFTAEAVGGVLGSLLVVRVTARFGQGPAMCASVVASGVLWLAAVPLFRADWRFVPALGFQAAGWVAFMTFKVGSVAVRQRLCPRPLLGRMTATVRFVVWGVMPVGALLGGVLGQVLGARAVLWIGAAGELTAVLPMAWSPVRGMAELPSAALEEEALEEEPLEARV